MNHKTERTSERRREAGQIVKSIRLVKEVHQRYSWELMKKYRMTGQQAGALSIVAHRPGISLGELGEQLADFFTGEGGPGPIAADPPVAAILEPSRFHCFALERMN